MKRELLSIPQKALAINSDPRPYGTFAEIGAGQEVARYFFQAGGAAATIAKSMSAYDMTFSDAIYGREEGGRYVCESRLRRMLEYEYGLIRERIWDSRPVDSTFFVFADTVTIRSAKDSRESHGWMGIRYQTRPKARANEVVIHIRMLDQDRLMQYEVLGKTGVNLIYAAFHFSRDPKLFIESLTDGILRKRIEIDMIHFSGPDFEEVDNRLLSLELVQQKLTNSVLFNPDGQVSQAADILRNKSVIVQRGSFRPVTYVNMDMQQQATTQFLQEHEIKRDELIVLMEITLQNLYADGDLDNQDFLDRVDILSSLNNSVLISNYPHHYQLGRRIRRYTKSPLVMVMGVSNLYDIFQEEYYEDLEGGILEAFGKLFAYGARLYIYPELDREKNDGTLITTTDLHFPVHLHKLYQYLLETKTIVDINECDTKKLHIYSRDVLRKMQTGHEGWEELLPPEVTEIIKERELLGYRKI